MSVDESVRFIAAARHDRLEAAWILGLTAGLRIGEMFGLQWTDIDLERSTVFVRRQALFVDGQLLIDDLKTADSLRLLPIGELAVAALRRRQEAAGNEPPSIWVFPSSNPETPMNPNNARRRNFADVVAFAGIPGKLTPHDLRHSMNSLADAVGIPEKVRSERLGHADSAITRSIYTHTIDGQARDAATKIDALLAKSSGTPHLKEHSPRVGQHQAEHSAVAPAEAQSERALTSILTRKGTTCAGSAAETPKDFQ